MKACMVAYTHYEYDTRVIQYAKALVERNIMVDAVALRKNDQLKFEAYQGVNLYRIQRRNLNEKRKISYLFKIIWFFFKSMIFLTVNHLKSPYDIIHVHSVPDFEVFAAWIPKLLGARVILDIHDIVPEFYAGKFNVNNNSLVFRSLVFIEKISCAFADHVIIANHIWQKTITSRSVPTEKCTVFLNYPDANIFSRREVNRNNGKFILIYPGTLNKHQGLDIAIRALSRMKDKLENVELHIYGEGPEKIELQNLASELSIEKHIIFKKVQPLEEIAQTMASADIGIVPKRATSFGNEAFSTKIFQFMSLGVPIIVSNTKIDSYYFNDSMVKFFQSGDSEDLSKSIVEIKEDRLLREKMVHNCLEYMEKNK